VVDNRPVPLHQAGGQVHGLRDERRRRTTLDHLGFFLLVLALAAAVAAMPFAIASMAGSLKHPVAADAFRLSVPAAGQRSTTALNIRLVGIDEVGQAVNLAVSGDRSCANGCGDGQILQVFSLHSDPRGSDGAPPSQDVAIPPSGEFDDSVTLPVEGSLGSYPFDHYRLFVGLALAAKTSGGQVVPIGAHSARDQLDVSVDDQLSRFDVSTPRDVTSNYRFVGAPVAVAAAVDLTRPLYLQALTVLIIVFIAIAGFYSVVSREFKEVIGAMGVVVLGVWGVRTLLVGGYPPDSTAVDLILTFLILMLLMVVMARGLAVIWRRIGRQHDGLDAPDVPVMVHTPEPLEDSFEDLVSDLA
jgi:hypothetical protein